MLLPILFDVVIQFTIDLWYDLDVRKRRTRFEPRFQLRIEFLPMRILLIGSRHMNVISKLPFRGSVFAHDVDDGPGVVQAGQLKHITPVAEEIIEMNHGFAIQTGLPQSCEVQVGGFTPDDEG
jgi:hypothetical protein